jgi:hypothetical protein
LTVELAGAGRKRCGRGGDTSEVTSSALPSSDSESRTFEDVGLEASKVVNLSGQDEGGECVNLYEVSTIPMA